MRPVGIHHVELTDLIALAGEVVTHIGDQLTVRTRDGILIRTVPRCELLYRAVLDRYGEDVRTFETVLVVRPSHRRRQDRLAVRDPLWRTVIVVAARQLSRRPACGWHHED